MGKTAEKQIKGKLFIFWLLANRVLLMKNNEKNNWTVKIVIGQQRQCKIYNIIVWSNVII